MSTEPFVGTVSPHNPRYALGESFVVANIRTLTSQKGLVTTAVTAPKAHLQFLNDQLGRGTTNLLLQSILDIEQRIETG